MRHRSGDGRDRDRGAVELDRLLCEAAAARRLRSLESLAGVAMEAREGDGRAVVALARRASAMVSLEALVAAGGEARVDAAGLLNRLATGVQLAAAGGSELASGFASASVPAGVARVVAAAMLEMVHVLDAGRDREARPCLTMASGLDGDELTVAVGVRGASAVPAGEALRSLRRARRMVRLVGGDLVRGIDGDGRHLLAISVGGLSGAGGGAADDGCDA